MKQVAALPVARDADGALRILMITSRETRRFIVPKGWPMKNKSDHSAAEIEARDEAGLVGRARKRPIGSYLAWKRQDDRFQLVRVKVFLFYVESHLKNWKEKGQRDIAWLAVEDAAMLIDEPGLAAIVESLPHRLPKSWRSWVSKNLSVEKTFGSHPIISTEKSGK